MMKMVHKKKRTMKNNKVEMKMMVMEEAQKWTDMVKMMTVKTQMKSLNFQVKMK